MKILVIKKTILTTRIISIITTTIIIGTTIYLGVVGLYNESIVMLMYWIGMIVLSSLSTLFTVLCRKKDIV